MTIRDIIISIIKLLISCSILALFISAFIYAITSLKFSLGDLVGFGFGLVLVSIPLSFYILSCIVAVIADISMYRGKDNLTEINHSDKYCPKCGKYELKIENKDKDTTERTKSSAIGYKFCPGCDYKEKITIEWVPVDCYNQICLTCPNYESGLCKDYDHDQANKKARFDSYHW